MIQRAATLVLLATAVAAGRAEAQDTHTFGLMMAYPTRVGAIWQPAKWLGIRPDISFRKSSTDVPFGELIDLLDNRAWEYEVGLSALFYVARWDELRAYVVPRFSYSRSRLTSQSFLVSGVYEVTPGPANSGFGGSVVSSGALDRAITPSENVFTSTTFTTAGSFGVQQGIGSRFAIFGEVGVDYERNSTNSETRLVTPSGSTPPRGIGDIDSLFDRKSRTVGTRSAVGVAFYF